MRKRTPKPAPRHSKAKPKARPSPVPAGLTPAVRRAVVAGVRDGVPWDVVASRAGVSRGTINKWRTHGQALSATFASTGKLPDGVTPEDMDCIRFFDEVEAAHNASIEKYAKCINRAAVKNWKAAAWMLERRAPQHFRLQKTQEAAEAKEEDSPTSGQRVFHLPDNGRMNK